LYEDEYGQLPEDFNYWLCARLARWTAETNGLEDLEGSAVIYDIRDHNCHIALAEFL